MRDLNELNHFRAATPAIIAYYGSAGDSNAGLFIVPIGERVKVAVIATAGFHWDHVSVSLPGRCPTWEEMDYIKRMFFKDDEWAMQLHAPPAEHINNHQFCLHLWRPHTKDIPVPPASMV